MHSRFTRAFYAIAVTLVALPALPVVRSYAGERASPARHTRHVGHGDPRRGRKPGAVVEHGGPRESAIATGVLLGDVAVESQYDTLAGGEAEAFELEDTKAGTTGAAHVFIGDHNRAHTLIVGLYASAAGHATTLLSTGSVSNLQADIWATVALAPVALLPGHSYWLAILGEGGRLRYRDRAEGPCTSQTSASRRLHALPGSWTGAARYSDCPLSAYVTATPTSAASTGPTLARSASQSHAQGEAPGATEQPASSLEQPAPGPPIAPPLALEPPLLSGHAVEGQSLGATLGTWQGSPTAYAVQWQVCNSAGEACTEIPEASSASYLLTAADVGHTLRVTVTASNLAGPSSATSAPSEVVRPKTTPANTSPPTVEGTPEEGQTLSASPGTWTEEPTGYAYQWEDCNSAGEACTNIIKANASSYTLKAHNVGHTIRVAVTASNELGGAKAFSETTEVVEPQESEPPPVAPVNVGLPVVSGVVEEGRVLSAGTGSWLGDPSSYAYQWEDCDSAGEGCVVIAKATSSSYVLVAGDVGHTLRVVVTATNAGGSTGASSAATGVVVKKESEPPPSGRTFYVAFVSGSEANSGESEASPWKRAPGMQGCVERCAEYQPKAGDRFIFKGGEEWPHSVFPFVVEHWGEAGHEDYYGVKESWHTGASYSPPVFNANHELITSSAPVGSPYKIDVMLWLREASYVTIEGITMENWTADGIKQSEGGWYCTGVELYDETGGEQVHLNDIRFTKWTSDYESEQNNCFVKAIRSNPQHLDNVSLTNSTVEGEPGKTMGWSVGCVGTVENDVIGNSTALVEPCPDKQGVSIVAHNRLFDCGYPRWPAGIKLAGGMHADAMQSENAPVINETDYIYDNVIDGTGNAGEGIIGQETGDPNKNGEWEGECEAGLLGGEEGPNAITIYMWNNIYYNILGNPPQIDGHINSYYAWNNTLEGGHQGAGACLVIAPPRTSHGNAEPDVFEWKNNLCVGGETGEEGAAPEVRGQSHTTHMGHNLVIEPAAVGKDHYETVRQAEEASAFDAFAPLSPAATGNGLGEDLHAQCTEGAAGLEPFLSLCESTSDGPLPPLTGGETPEPRPATGSWDIGAYQ
jgi:hypothetical protein